MKKGRVVFSTLFFGTFLVIATSALSQTLTVTSPNGGERWTIGRNQVITWTAQGITGNVMILVLPSGSNNIYKIAEGIPAGQGSYTWPAGTVTTGSLQANQQFRIRVYKDPQHYDDSNGTVTLLRGIQPGSAQTAGPVLQQATPPVTLQPSKPSGSLQQAKPTSPQQVPQMASADLAIREVFYNQGKLWVKIRNNGGTYSGRLLIHRRQGTSPAVQATDITVSISQNQEMDYQLGSMQWPDNTAYLMYDVILDPLNTIGEANEANNTFRGKVYHSRGFDPKLLAGSAVIIGQGGRAKPIVHNGTMILDRNDALDSVEYYSTFAFDVRYTIINYGSGGGTAGYRLKTWNNSGEMIKESRPFIGAGETKTITERIWSYTDDNQGSIEIRNVTGGPGLIVSLVRYDQSLLNWLSFRPQLRVYGVSVTPQNPRAGSTVRFRSDVWNGGGRVHNQATWRQLCRLVHPQQGEMRSWMMEYRGTPGTHAHHYQDMEFTLPQQSERYTMYTIKCTIQSDFPIIDNKQPGRDTKQIQFEVDQ